MGYYYSLSKFLDQKLFTGESCHDLHNFDILTADLAIRIYNLSEVKYNNILTLIQL